MSHRRLEYLHRNEIIYRRHPILDKPNQVFDWGEFYENGTYECYELFRSKAKITTYKSLKWHLLVLWYLNDLSDEKFSELALFICDKDNGFITFNIPPDLLDRVINEVIGMNAIHAPKNRLRKVIFKDGCGLSISEKLQIVGSLIGRSKISKQLIYDAMLEINHNDELITISKLAKACGCSTRTIHRNIDKLLKKEKELLNKTLHEKI
jgi:predicted transcriptional regulator